MELTASSMLKLVVAVFVGFLLYILITGFLSGFTSSFSKSICKFSAYIRAAVFGNPLLQLAMSQGEYIFGGFAGVKGGIVVPLACSPAPQLPDKEVYELGVVVEKIS